MSQYVVRSKSYYIVERFLLVNLVVPTSDVTSDSPRRIDSLGSFFKKESIQKIRSLRIEQH